MRHAAIVFMAFGALLATGVAARAGTVIYADRTAWEAAVGGSYEEEFFTDPTLNPGVSVVSDDGGVGVGVWADQMAAGSQSTTWMFATPIHAFGGNWDLAGPGGSGVGINVDAGDPSSFIGSISNTLAGTFWGFVSTDSFTKVYLTAGNQAVGVETFYFDNMVYSAASAVPLPSAAWMGFGLLGAFAFLSAARRRRRVARETLA